MFLLKGVFIEKAQIKEVILHLYRLLKGWASTTPPLRPSSGSSKPGTLPSTTSLSAMSVTGLSRFLERSPDAPTEMWQTKVLKPHLTAVPRIS